MSEQLNRYGITSTTISVFVFKFPFLGGSIFFIPWLSDELTTYPPIRDPWSGAPLSTDRKGKRQSPLAHVTDKANP